MSALTTRPDLLSIIATGTVPVTHACPECGGEGFVWGKQCIRCGELFQETPPGIMRVKGASPELESLLPCGHNIENYQTCRRCGKCDGAGTVVTDVPLTELLHPQTLEALA